jgi:hypothetical protein
MAGVALVAVTELHDEIIIVHRSAGKTSSPPVSLPNVGLEFLEARIVFK